jgi:hypothetical protein
MTTFYVGNTPQDILTQLGNSRYFYALRRSEEGDLFFAKIDQLIDQDTIILNDPGPTEDNYEEFEYGIDFFDGRLAEDHSRPYPNLHWDQYRWDTRSMYYYINNNGELIVRINQSYTYPPGSEV